MHSSKNLSWYKLADTESALDFGVNDIAVTVVKGKTICVGKHQDKIFAFAHKCPHAGSFLSQGWIDPLGNVVCALHRYKFNPVNGRNVSGEGYYLKHWPVEKRQEGLFVGMEESSFLNWI